MEDTPKFVHDCECCKFLGHFSGQDLYFCPQPLFNTPTVVARWSSEGPDYMSGLGFNKLSANHPLTVAKNRAIEAGYLPETNNYQIQQCQKNL